MRQSFLDYMRSNGILCVFHYLPLHLSVMGQKYGGQSGDCPVTEDVSERLVRIPFFNKLSSYEQNLIIEKTILF